MTSLKKRVISAIVALLIVIPIIIVKSYFLLALILIVSVLSIKELDGAFSKKNFKSSPILASCVSLFLILFTFYMAQVSNFTSTSKLKYIVSAIAGVVILFQVTVFYFMAKKKSLQDVLFTYFEIFYVGLPFVLFASFSNTDLIYYVFFIPIATDTSAYTVGSLFGKKKLAPSISPNKTVEGAVGGLLGAVIVTLVLAIYFIKIPLYLAALLGLLGGFMCIIGDLLASLIKRYTGIKDFGNVMPGHGGFLDRLDSIIFIIPLVFVIYITVW